MRAVILDLDDTLYPERRFLISGFAAVAGEVERTAGVPACTAFRALVRSVRRGGRGRAFQDLCAVCGIDAGLVPTLVEAYRDHSPRLRLPRSARELLHGLRPDFRVAILTNGLPAVQRRKVTALGLEALVDSVVYAHETGAGKPDLAAFARALAALDVPRHRAVMVGNDPECDIAGARAAGLRTIRVRRAIDEIVPAGGDEADATVDGLQDVRAEAVRLLQERA